MISYTFREDAPLPIKGAKDADAQVIGEALEEIRVRAGGELTPGAVVEAARSSQSALHPHFEWNDKAAAESFRLDQARGIIRCIRIVEKDESEPIRAFVSVASRGGISYRSVGDIQRSPDLQDAVLARAEKDLEAFEQRYKELRDICSLVLEAKSRVKERRRALRQETRAA